MKQTKMSGAGNTFIVLDGREIDEGTDLAQLAPEICDALGELGGADGLIAIYPADPSDVPEDFVMRYYNRDGSTGMMCGNGARCAVRFAADLGFVGDESSIRFTNADVVYHAEITDRGVKVFFPDPKRFKLRFKLNFLGDMRFCHYADVGTPHAVVFVDEMGDPRLTSVDQLDLKVWGPAVRHHPDFAPDGANANFVEVPPQDLGQGSSIRLRTFERGVEAETGACGTGAISSAIIASTLRNLPPPIAVTTTSGSTLWVDFRVVNERVTDVSLEGNAFIIIN